MTQPSTMSGQPEPVQAVTSAIAMMARLTATSSRAERKAAPLSEPPWWRTRTSSSAHTVFTTAAPDAVTTIAATSGATGSSALTTARAVPDRGIPLPS